MAKPGRSGRETLRARAGSFGGPVLDSGSRDAGDRLADEPAQVFRGLLGVTVTLVALQSVLHLVDVGFDLQIDRLNADSDRSVWSWAGSAAELMAALGAALLLVLRSSARKPIIFLVLVLAFFSLDDAVQVHEQLSHVLEKSSRGSWVPARMVWPILYAPLMLATAVLLWRVGDAMVPRCRRALRGGLVMLGVAVVLEFGVGAISLDVGGFDAPGASSMRYASEVVAEEGLELAGWLLVAAALVATALDLLLRQARASQPSVPVGISPPTEPSPQEAPARPAGPPRSPASRSSRSAGVEISGRGQPSQGRPSS